METESLELEDGEVVDDEPIDAFEAYNVLQRPHAVPSVPEPSAKLRYSDDSDLSEVSESDSDSDEGPKMMKRPKIKIKRCKSSGQSRSANDKYKVWCTQVQEESLTEDLVSCGVTKSLYHDRSVESYDYTLGYSHTNKHRDNNTSDEDQEVEPRLTNKRTFADRRNVKLRLGKRRNNHEEEDDLKGSARIIPDLSVTIESTNEEVAADIACKLSEKKDDLIKRVVEILGKEKAISFFQETKKIEEEGGMLIMNGSRRRTAGGIYLFLVKHDDHIPQPKIREIFYQDKKETTDNRKMAESHRKQKTQELMKFLENGSDKDLPALLTRAELSTRQIAEEARLRRGEGMDRIPIDSDRTVSNPPPSPVTDDPDHSEPPNPPVCSRRVQDYGEDFLDIGVEVDMEVF